MTTCIIGASSSIGKELLRKCNSEKEKVIATYNNTKINDNTAKVLRLDLTKIEDIESFKPKNISHLIFLQGSLIGKKIGDYENDEIASMIEINLSSILHLLNNMIKNECFSDQSLITLVSSISAIKGSYDLVYSSTKSALIGCARSIALNSESKIRANVICPGLIEDSSMYNSMSSEDHERHLKGTPTKQLTKIKDIAELIFSLNKPMFKNMNGAIINIDGGRHL